jgi:hypothetical protein
MRAAWNGGGGGRSREGIIGKTRKKEKGGNDNLEGGRLK